MTQATSARPPSIRSCQFTTDRNVERLVDTEKPRSSAEAFQLDSWTWMYSGGGNAFTFEWIPDVKLADQQTQQCWLFLNRFAWHKFSRSLDEACASRENHDHWLWCCARERLLKARCFTGETTLSGFWHKTFMEICSVSILFCKGEKT